MTAVEWLEEKAKEFVIDLDLLHYFEQAKEMEKQYLFNTLVDFVGFPHDHEEPRGVTIARFLEQLKNK
jgi:phosphoribosylformylglycinamidine (FGAM) synthase PurS component